MWLGRESSHDVNNPSSTVPKNEKEGHHGLCDWLGRRCHGNPPPNCGGDDDEEQQQQQQQPDNNNNAQRQWRDGAWEQSDYFLSSSVDRATVASVVESNNHNESTLTATNSAPPPCNNDKDTRNDTTPKEGNHEWCAVVGEDCDVALEEDEFGCKHLAESNSNVIMGTDKDDDALLSRVLQRLGGSKE